MSTKSPSSQTGYEATKRPRLLIIAAACAFLLVAFFHLASAKAGYSHYRDIHLGTAIEYAKGQIDLLRPVIVGFNLHGTPTPQELPIWQALAGAVFKLAGPWFGWGNLVSLVLFAAGLWPLFALARQYMDERGAWWTLLFYLFQPILIFIAGQASADGLSLGLAVWFLFFADKLVRTGRVAWLAPSILFGALSAVTKMPLFVSVGLTSFFLLLLHSGRSPKAWGLLIATGLASGVVFMVWTRYTDSCLALAEFPHVELRLSHSPAMWDWYFGTWQYRLNPFNWAKGGWAALNSLLGSFALFALAGWAALFSRNRLAQFWLLAAICTTLVFSHLVLVHRHYYILFSPPMALLCASGLRQIEELMKLEKPWQQAVEVAGLWVVLLLGAVQGLLGMEIVLGYDPYPHEMARTIDRFTTPQERLLVQGGGWGGDIFLLSRRQGLTIDDTGFLEDAKVLQRLVSLGFTKIVLISESPLLHALQVTNPGSQNRQRGSYKAHLTKVAAPWKTLFESEDIVIKELPEKTE